MHRVRQEQLPFQGMSQRFVGTDNGDVGISVRRKAGEIHSFLSIGDVPLKQLDIHLGSRFGGEPGLEPNCKHDRH